MDLLFFAIVLSTPVIGLIFLDRRQKSSAKQNIFDYLTLLTFSHLITAIFYFIFSKTDPNFYQISIPFLIKYTVFNSASSLTVAFMKVFIQEHVDLKITSQSPSKKFSSVIYLLISAGAIIIFALLKSIRNLDDFLLYYLHNVPGGKNVSALGNLRSNLSLKTLLLLLVSLFLVLLMLNFFEFQIRLIKKKNTFQLAFLKYLLPALLLVASGYGFYNHQSARQLVASLTQHSPSFDDDVAVFPQPTQIITISIDTEGQELPSSKGDGVLPVFIRFGVDDKILNTYGEISVQGSSTALWPKKNWSLRFYKDDKREEKLKIKLGDQVATDKLVAKAEWIDPGMMRNAVSYTLWGQMVESRTTKPKYEVDNAFVNASEFSERHGDARGFPVPHPSVVYVDGDFYGLAVLLDAHEPDNFNIDKNNPNHVYMEFDDRGGSSLNKGWSKFSYLDDDGRIHLVSYLDDFSEEQKIALDRLSLFINGPQSSFTRNFDQYLDKQNMIDMLLYIEALTDYDAVAQDIEIISYNLQKWYFLPWDKDTTFGVYPYNTGIRQQLSGSTTINYQSESPTQTPWFKTYHAFKPDVEARYAELRSKGVFSVENLTKMIDQLHSLTPDNLWQSEADRWEKEGRLKPEGLDGEQIIEWFEQRLELLDGVYGYKQLDGRS